MKVLEIGRPQSGWGAELECEVDGGCGAKLFVEEDDIIVKRWRRFDESGIKYRFECPQCGMMNELDPPPGIPREGRGRNVAEGQALTKGPEPHAFEAKALGVPADGCRQCGQLPGALVHVTDEMRTHAAFAEGLINRLPRLLDGKDQDHPRDSGRATATAIRRVVEALAACHMVIPDTSPELCEVRERASQALKAAADAGFRIFDQGKPPPRHSFVTATVPDARSGRGRCVECGAPEGAPIHDIGNACRHGYHPGLCGKCNDIPDPNLEKIQTVVVENHPLTKAGQGRSNRAQILLDHLETLRGTAIVGVVARCPNGHEVQGATEVLHDIFAAAGFWDEPSSEPKGDSDYSDEHWAEIQRFEKGE